MTADDLSDDLLTMLAKCEVARCVENNTRITMALSTLAYPSIASLKRHGLLAQLEAAGLVAFENGFRPTSKGRAVLKQFTRIKR